MKPLLSSPLCLLLSVLSVPAVGASLHRPAEWEKTVDIPYIKFALTNGLTLLVHEDHKASIVAVNIWYHVASKNEKPGRTGFAHLFEHLMFNGSEHSNDDYFQAMERIGATDLNGTTSEDRTNYFEDAPTPALDLVLWMESDRMGHLLGVIDQAKLDEQRGVVQNEKRQGENEPYGRVWELIAKATYPAGHPYSWTVIGSMEDLNAASLADAHEWFKTYYGPANAVLVLAGDIDPATAREKVERYFGDIPSGPPLARFEAWTAKRAGTQQQILQDRVPQARLYQVWNIPAYGTLDTEQLALAAGVLGSGKNSRLYERLVYRDQIASDASAYVDAREIAGQFYIEVTARPGQDLAQVEQVVDEELARFRAKGPTKKELQRVQAERLAGFIRGVERIGGFGGKSDVLAQNQVFLNDPTYYQTSLRRQQSATTDDLRRVAREWLSDGRYVLEVHPFAEYGTNVTTVDRSKPPVPGAAPEACFPTLLRATLANGLKIVLAERHAIPVVRFNLLLDAGFAADQAATPGTANLAMDMLDEGTRTRTSLQISEELALLGARLSTGCDLDSSFASLSALKMNLDPSLAIYADVILNPSFPEADFRRLQKLQLDTIEQEKVQPIQMALRVLPRLLYGAGHAYGNPLTGSGTTESTKRLTRPDMVRFHETWFKPNHATLVVVGDTTLAEVQPKLEKLFARWKPGDVPRKNVTEVVPAARPVIYVIDRPESIQSVVLAGHVAPPKANPDEPAIESMNTVLGGAFTSRINMNIREDKHWSYGAGSFLPGARGPRPFLVYAPVQTDKTKETMLELDKELRGILGPRPITEDEVTKVKNNLTLELAGRWETAGAVAGSIGELVVFDLGDDYYHRYAARIRALQQPDLVKAAQTVVHPDSLVWVVVGTRAQIEAPIRELGWGEIRFVDADGNPEK
jgi:zinc protease